MRIKALFIILFSLLVFNSCKTQFDILLESDDTDLKYKTAFSLFEQKKYSKAAVLFESLKIALKGTEQDDTVQYYTALSHYKYGDMYSAEPCFESFITVFPRSPFTEEAKYLRITCLYDQTLRYELDQTPTHKAMAVIMDFIADHPTTVHLTECTAMLDDLNERLDKKAYESAKLYYTTEEYKSAHYAFKNVIKEDAENRYREDILYYTAMSSYKYALNSVSSKQKERYMSFNDDYYNFIGEFPDSKYRKELEQLYKKVQEILK